MDRNQTMIDRAAYIRDLEAQQKYLEPLVGQAELEIEKPAPVVVPERYSSTYHIRSMKRNASRLRT